MSSHFLSLKRLFVNRGKAQKVSATFMLVSFGRSVTFGEVAYSIGQFAESSELQRTVRFFEDGPLVENMSAARENAL